jgi:hypothetical protein
MQETRMAKTIHCWKPISKRPTGRPQTHWEDDIKKDIQKLKVPSWRTLVQDRRRWKELVEKAKRCIKSCRAVRRRRRIRRRRRRRKTNNKEKEKEEEEDRKRRKKKQKEYRGTVFCGHSVFFIVKNRT